MRIFVLLLAALVFSGCASMKDFFMPSDIEESAKIKWRKNLKMKINNIRYRGLAVVPKAGTYEMKIYPTYKEIDRLQWGTCHGDDFADEAVENSIWPWGKDDDYFKLNFTPEDVELERACPLNIEALTKKHKLMDFGMVIFPPVDPSYRLYAALQCNRQRLPGRGYNGCQAPVGAITTIEFPIRVLQSIAPDEQCPPMEQITNSHFEFYMPRGWCTYTFEAEVPNADGEIVKHVIHTYGYEENPPPRRD